jgi:D-3-phosphoglycerate dehydrogenase
MQSKTILITTSSFGKLDSQAVHLLESEGFQIVLNPYKRKLTEEEVAKLIATYNPLGMIAGVEPLTRSVLEHATGLKVISRCGIGLDSVDLQAAAASNIKVLNTPDAPTIAVAELTLGMILSLLRKIHLSDAGMRRGEWTRPYGRLLHGKTVGIIGCGRIGSCLAKLLQPFECKVLGCDPVCTIEENLTLVDAENILQQSDIISLHIPYSGRTHHFINQERIKMMKDSSYLINAARGGLVDEQALYGALVSGKLAGAAFDCFEDEPYAGNLVNLENVLLTAHIGSYAQEARVMMETEAVKNLLSVLKNSGGSL